MTDEARSADIEALLARREDNGADYWATPDGRIYVGNPYSTLSCLGILHELQVGPEHEAVVGALNLVLAAGRRDGRIRLGPKTPMYPCYTAEAARMLCRFGLERDPVVERAVDYFMGSGEITGGWRCSFSRFGKGPETKKANPGATLYVLDVLRWWPELSDGKEPVVARAVESLLEHWDVREPTGPCHWGIGSTFLRVEYPFFRYNLFFWVYVLSHFPSARNDPRFQAALRALDDKVDEEGRIVVEAPHRNLKGLTFCARGEPSAQATGRYREILQRVSHPR